MLSSILKRLLKHFSDLAFIFILQPTGQYGGVVNGMDFETE